MTNSMKLLFEAVESPKTAARLNVASGSEHFLRLLSRNSIVRELLVRAKCRDQAEGILQRLLHLVQQSVDPRYENPFDTALAGYMFVLQSTHLDLAHLASEAVLASARHCWWAERTAREATTRKRTTDAPVSEEIQESSPLWQLSAPDADTPITIANYVSDYLQHTGNVMLVTLSNTNSPDTGSALTGADQPYVVHADNSDRPELAA